MRHHREARERAFVAEEEEYRRQLMAKFAEDDRLEQLNQQKRRLKVCRGKGSLWGDAGGVRQLMAEHAEALPSPLTVLSLAGTWDWSFSFGVCCKPICVRNPGPCVSRLQLMPLM